MSRLLSSNCTVTDQSVNGLEQNVLSLPANGVDGQSARSAFGSCGCGSDCFGVDKRRVVCRDVDVRTSARCCDAASLNCCIGR